MPDRPSLGRFRAISAASLVRGTPRRDLSDREEAEHRRLVRLAVVLPLALAEPDGDGLRARERDGREGLLELSARLTLDHEVVDGPLVGDDERVGASLQGLHLRAVALERDREAGPDGALELRRRHGRAAERGCGERRRHHRGREDHNRSMEHTVLLCDEVRTQTTTAALANQIAPLRPSYALLSA